MMQHVAHRHSDEMHQLRTEIERLRAALLPCPGWLEYAYRNVDSITATAVKAHLPAIHAALEGETVESEK